MSHTNFSLSDVSVIETSSTIPELSLFPQNFLKRLQTPSNNILDVNWISSSEDDSFTRELVQKSSFRTSAPPAALANVLEEAEEKQRNCWEHENLPSIPKRRGSHSFLNFPSSPNSDHPESVPSTQPSAASQLRQPNFLRRTTDRSFIVSDPIVSSSPQSSPLKRPKTSHVYKSVTNKQKNEKDGYSIKQWNTANKATWKEEEVLAEMVVEVALCIHCKVKNDYFLENFANICVRDTYMDVPLISWKRRVKARYDKENDVFVPCELTEICESVYCLIYDGAELAYKIRDGTVIEDLQKTKRRAEFEKVNDSCHIVIVSPGFNAYVQKLRAAEDKEYKRQMLQKLEIAEDESKKKKSLLPDMTAAEVKMLKVETEVQLGINIFTCKDMNEAIDWLLSFTSTIGKSLYSKQKRNAQYANLGNVKLGTNAKSTFLSMLQNFNLVTKPKAQRIYNFYSSPTSLYHRFMENESLGTFEGKSVATPTANKAMRRVFLSEDPSQVITD